MPLSCQFHLIIKTLKADFRSGVWNIDMFRKAMNNITFRPNLPRTMLIFFMSYLRVCSHIGSESRIALLQGQNTTTKKVVACCQADVISVNLNLFKILGSLPIQQNTITQVNITQHNNFIQVSISLVYKQLIGKRKEFIHGIVDL